MNTSRNKDRWDSLSMKEKSDMMKAAVQQGIYNLSEIRKAYNEYAEGGTKNNGTPRPVTTGGAGYIPPAPTSIPFTFNPDRIVQDVPAREWGPTPINFDENGELNIGEQGEGNGGVADSMYYYLLQRGNKLGDKNIEIALNNLKNNPWYFNEKIPDEDISFAFSEKRPVFEKDNISKATTDQKKALAAHYIADSENYLNHAGAMRRYFGKDDLGVLRESAYKPGISKDPNSKYYIFNNMLAPGYWDPVVEDLVQSEEKSKHYYDPTLNEFTASKGHDNIGDYVSIYDVWDYNTNVVGRKNNSSPDNIKHVVNGKPFDIYHRVYLDDYYDVPNNKKGSYFLPEVTVTPDKKSLGGPLVQLANRYEEGGPTEEDRVLDLSDRGYKSKKDLQQVGNPPMALAGAAARAVEYMLQGPARFHVARQGARYIEPAVKYVEKHVGKKAAQFIKDGYESLARPFVNYGRYYDNPKDVLINATMKESKDTVKDMLFPQQQEEEYAYGGPLVDRANQYALGGNMYGWGDFLKGSYNSIKDTASNVVDKAGDALISAANWLHDALKVDSPTPAATTKPYVEQDYTSPAFMPYSYGSTSNYNVDDSSWDETKEVQLPEITITTDKVLKELPVEKLSQNEYLRNEYNKDNSVEEARKLNREDLKKLQQTLADKGYYDLNTDNMSVDEIKNIQKKIGAKVDGIAGKETREKWRQYNVDGLWGKRTEEAILKGTKRDYWDRDVTTDNTEWCAEWVHKKAVNATGNDNCGVWGDAWRMPQNVVKNGGTEVYNIYNDKAFRGITDVTSLKKATEKALKEHPFDISTLRVGDIVGIYMPSSNMHSTALRDGTTFNTHVGVVTGFDKNGKPVIEHNIHKNHHKDAADNIRGSLVGKARIATVSRPDYGTPQKAFEVESAPSEYTKESDSPLFKQYAESAAGSKELLQNVFPNVDIDEVERIALAVQGRETGFMKNKRSDQTGISGLKVKAGDYYRDNIMGKNAESVSSNLAKMKLTSFDPNERYMLGLTDPKDLEDPKKAGTAAMYLMAKNYSYFKNLQESYPQLGITDDDIRYLTELSYNQGMSKLRNIGFTSEGAAAPEELEAIRAMADENAKIKDVSATNYRYLGSLGKMLYDAFADGHTPYIAAAEKYRRQLMENADTE